MKAILTFLTTIFFSSQLFAQWTPSGSNIYYNGGNVGIGTSAPAWKLHASAAYATVQQRLERTGNGTGIADLGADSDGLHFFVGGYPGNALHVLFGANGNVGIGVSNPSYKLQVSGGGFFQHRLVVQGDIANDNNAAFWNYSTIGYGLYSQGGSGGKYSFHFLNRDGVSILYGKGDGQIGIGTTSPDSKLTVKGTVHAEEVKVDLSVPGPDYVFEEDYALQSLEEIESYVKVNKHLPDVPSAMEMEEEGIKVGEMNMLLLRKIEEMTLHMISQNEVIKSQADKVVQLEQRLKELETKN